MTLRVVVGLAFILLAAGVGGETLSGRVTRVIDGDTLVVLLAGKREERVRLAGIDCPERGQASTRVKEALLARVGGVGVSVKSEKRDRYGRVVGKVIDSEGDVNLALVRSGMCWWYRKYADEQSHVDRVLYEAAEVSARKGRVGLLRDPEPVAPWEWRR